MQDPDNPLWYDYEEPEEPRNLFSHAIFHVLLLPLAMLIWLLHVLATGVRFVFQDVPADRSLVARTKR